MRFATAVLACISSLLCVAAAGHAQNASPVISSTPIFISTADIAKAAARSAEQRSSAPKATRVTTLLRAGAYNANLEFREGPSPDIHAHVNEGELFVVLQGTGTMTVGGQLIDPSTRDGTRHALRSVGGTLYHLSPGDVLLLPEDTPHSVTHVDGRLVMMSMHLPRSVDQPHPETRK